MFEIDVQNLSPFLSRIPGFIRDHSAKVDNEALCEERITELHGWVDETSETYETSRAELTSLLKKILEVTQQNDYQITGDQEFLEWAFWHNMDGSPPCEITSEGFELCFTPDFSDKIDEGIELSSKEDLEKFFHQVVMFRGEHGIEPVLDASLPKVDLSVCGEAREEEGYDLLYKLTH